MSTGHLKKGCLTVTPNLLSQKMGIWAAREPLEAHVQQEPLMKAKASRLSKGYVYGTIHQFVKTNKSRAICGTFNFPT